MPEVVSNLVSTIIPVYNRPEMLREAVESVLAQTYRPIEVIISDDGSTDDAGLVADRMAGEHPAVIRVVHNPNRGAGLAREAGRAVAKGEFIQYLDSDDRLLPRKFELQVQALRMRPDCGAAYGYIQRYGADDSADRVPLKWSGRELPTLFPWLLVDRWWNTDCPLFRRSVCDATGPWTDLRYSQDWEYDARVGALGVRLAHVKDFVCEYRQHGGERQTGSGKWLSPPDRVRFLSLLFRHARTAGVALRTPEMRHFSRWAFLNARQCAEAGDAASARACLALAGEAAGGTTPDMRVFKALASVLGWGNAARLASWAIARTGRRPGVGTLPLSTASGAIHA